MTAFGKSRRSDLALPKNATERPLYAQSCRFNMRTLMILDAGTEIDEVLGAAVLSVYGRRSVCI